MWMVEKLISVLDNFPYELSDYIDNNNYLVIDNHIELADYLIAADVVPIVRCKNCWYYKEVIGKDSGKPCGYGICNNQSGLRGIIFDEYFCSYGEA